MIKILNTLRVENEDDDLHSLYRSILRHYAVEQHLSIHAAAWIYTELEIINLQQLPGDEKEDRLFFIYVSAHHVAKAISHEPEQEVGLQLGQRCSALLHQCKECDIFDPSWDTMLEEPIRRDPWCLGPFFTFHASENLAVFSTLPLEIETRIVKYLDVRSMEFFRRASKACSQLGAMVCYRHLRIRNDRDDLPAIAGVLQHNDARSYVRTVTIDISHPFDGAIQEAACGPGEYLLPKAYQGFKRMPLLSQDRKRYDAAYEERIRLLLNIASAPSLQNMIFEVQHDPPLDGRLLEAVPEILWRARHSLKSLHFNKIPRSWSQAYSRQRRLQFWLNAEWYRNLEHVQVDLGTAYRSGQPEIMTFFHECELFRGKSGTKKVPRPTISFTLRDKPEEEEDNGIFLTSFDMCPVSRNLRNVELSCVTIRHSHLVRMVKEMPELASVTLRQISIYDSEAIAKTLEQICLDSDIVLHLTGYWDRDDRRGALEFADFNVNGRQRAMTQECEKGYSISVMMEMVRVTRLDRVLPAARGFWEIRNSECYPVEDMC